MIQLTYSHIGFGGGPIAYTHTSPTVSLGTPLFSQYDSDYRYGVSVNSGVSYGQTYYTVYINGGAAAGSYGYNRLPVTITEGGSSVTLELEDAYHWFNGIGYYHSEIVNSDMEDINGVTQPLYSTRPGFYQHDAYFYVIFPKPSLCIVISNPIVHSNPLFRFSFDGDVGNCWGTAGLIPLDDHYHSANWNWWGLQSQGTFSAYYSYYYPYYATSFTRSFSVESANSTWLLYAKGGTVSGTSIYHDIVSAIRHSAYNLSGYIATTPPHGIWQAQIPESSLSSPGTVRGIGDGVLSVVSGAYQGRYSECGKISGAIVYDREPDYVRHYAGYSYNSPEYTNTEARLLFSAPLNWEGSSNIFGIPSSGGWFTVDPYQQTPSAVSVPGGATGVSSTTCVAIVPWIAGDCDAVTSITGAATVLASPVWNTRPGWYPTTSTIHPLFKQCSDKRYLAGIVQSAPYYSSNLYYAQLSAANRFAEYPEKLSGACVAAVHGTASRGQVCKIINYYYNSRNQQFQDGYIDNRWSYSNYRQNDYYDKASIDGVLTYKMSGNVYHAGSYGCYTCALVPTISDGSIYHGSFNYAAETTGDYANCYLNSRYSNQQGDHTDGTSVVSSHGYNVETSETLYPSISGARLLASSAGASCYYTMAGAPLACAGFTDVYGVDANYQQGIHMQLFGLAIHPTTPGARYWPELNSGTSYIYAYDAYTDYTSDPDYSSGSLNPTTSFYYASTINPAINVGQNSAYIMYYPYSNLGSMLWHWSGVGSGSGLAYRGGTYVNPFVLCSANLQFSSETGYFSAYNDSSEWDKQYDLTYIGTRTTSSRAYYYLSARPCGDSGVMGPSSSYMSTVLVEETYSTDEVWSEQQWTTATVHTSTHTNYVAVTPLSNPAIVTSTSSSGDLIERTVYVPQPLWNTYIQEVYSATSQKIYNTYSAYNELVAAAVPASASTGGPFSHGETDFGTSSVEAESCYAILSYDIIASSASVNVTIVPVPSS